jgi:drug/metabolite transporter (DMT)-like permease
MDVRGALFIAVWSSGYIGGSVAATAIAPLAANRWRFLIGGAVLAVIAVVRGEKWPRGAAALAAAGGIGVLLFTVQFGGLYTGMAEGTPAATTALIACSSPLLVAAVGALLGWDRLSPRRWAGILLGLVGVAVTLGDRLGRPPTAAALAWTLLGLAGLAAGTVLQGRLRSTAGPAALAATEIAGATVVMAAWAPFEGSLSVPATPAAIGSLLWISIVPGVVGPLLLFGLIRERGATRASSLLFVVPAVTALAAWPILGTPVGPTAALGLVIAGAGLWLARARPADAALLLDTAPPHTPSVHCTRAAADVRHTERVCRAATTGGGTARAATTGGAGTRGAGNTDGAATGARPPHWRVPATASEWSASPGRRR